MAAELESLFHEMRRCRLCEQELSHGPNPIIRGSEKSRLLIIGQAPGIRVHNTGIPFNDPSGDRLRQWLDITRDVFYNEDNIAIMPMGLCYPGTGDRGDLPPPKRCAPQWHHRVLALMPNVKMTLLVRSYAQKYYLKPHYKTLTQALKQWQENPSNLIPLPHPSPRNNLWLKKNPWFEEDILPLIRERLAAIPHSSSIN
ncbi:MAG: uracil-DNA glycosylase family protein [Cellvibrionaceae bacterium]